MKNERILDITIAVLPDGFFDVGIYDPASGDYVHKDFPISPDEHPEFNEWVGNEIYDWVCMINDGL